MSMLLLGAGRGTPVRLLVDEWTTDDAAPIASPRTCEPGPGSLTFTDSANVMGISSSRLVISGTPTASDGWLTSSMTRTAGLAMLMRLVAAGADNQMGGGNSKIGFVSTNAITGTEQASVSPYIGGDLFAYLSTGNGPQLVDVIAADGRVYDLGVILRGTGAFILARSPGEDWKLAYVLTTGSTTPVYARHRLSANAYVQTFDDLVLCNLPAPWTSDNGIATARTASASANDTITHEANCLIECTRTVASNDTWDVSFRRTDDDNGWVVRADQAGGTLRLYEKVAGVETQRATASFTITAASHRVVIVADGQKVRVIFDTTARLSYDSAATNLTATEAKTNLAGTEFIAWPRTLSGSALGAVAQFYPYGTPGTTLVYADNSLAADSTAYNPATRLGTGGTSRAYKTLLGAISAVSTGGTIQVRAGTYSELGSASVCFNLAKAMTLQAYTGESVTLTYPEGSPPLASAEAGDYGAIVQIAANVTLDGFTIVGTGALSDPGDRNGDSDISVKVNNLGKGTIRNCTFTGWGHAAIKWPSTIAGALTIEGNLIQTGGITRFDHCLYASNSASDGARIVIRHNAFLGAHGYGVHAYSAPTNLDIYANVIANCGEAGMFIGGSGHTVRNNTIYNNGIGTDDQTPQGGIVLGDLSNSTFQNNIVRGNTYIDGYADVNKTGGTVSGLTCTTNNIESMMAIVDAVWPDGGTDFSSDPLFSDSTPETFDDLKLQAGSPCVGAGTLVADITLLDPAVSSRPTAKSSSTSTTVGAFAP